MLTFQTPSDYYNIPTTHMATLTIQRQAHSTIQIKKVSSIIILCLYICIVATLHLLHSNKSATKAYVMRKLEVQKTDLTSENQILRMQTARAKSLPHLMNNQVTQGMVDITSPTFARK